ncbi:MAG: MBL fold metallo-hydrolase [Clostridiaceae bacterium]
MKRRKSNNSNLLMWLALILFAPLGIFLMWKNKRFNKPVRVILSAFFSMVFLVAVVPTEDTNNNGNSNLMADNQQEQSIDDEKEEQSKDEDVVEDNKTPEDSSDSEEQSDAKLPEENNQEEDKSTEVSAGKDNNKVTGTLKVHFIDVGQADSILIQQGDNAMLIDGGNRADDNTVKSYLDSQGITDLQYVIGTHVHEDHIGGLSYIINSFKVGKIYFPRQTATTKVFESFVTAAKNKGLNFTLPEVGKTFKLGEAVCTILAPKSSSYSGSNDYSIVLKVVYGNNSFLFTGDAEAVSEMEMVNGGLNLKADVLKLGHHGSKTATVTNFLKAVNPKYAVISVGEDNKYGLPSQSVMDRLKNDNIPVYRTDESGTIVATSDGNTIKFNTKPGSYNPGNAQNSNTESNSNTNTNNNSVNSQVGNSSAGSNKTESNNESNNNAVATPEASNTVYWTPGGKSYHTTKDCSTLSRSKTIYSGSLSDCPKDDPCDVCH